MRSPASSTGAAVLVCSVLPGAFPTAANAAAVSASVSAVRDVSVLKDIGNSAAAGSAAAGRWQHRVGSSPSAALLSPRPLPFSALLEEMGPEETPDKKGLMRWAGIIAAFLLIASLPVASFYSVWVWHCRFTAGQLNFNLRGTTFSDTRVWATGSLVVYVVLLIAADTLASYTAQAHQGHYPWQPMVIVLLVEASKLFVSIGMHYVNRDTAGVEPVPWSTWGSTCLRLLPVAAIYAGNNFLVFYALARVQLSDYVVWRNTSIIFNALLWTWILQRKLSFNKWVGVSFLFAGCCLNSLETSGLLSESVGFPVLICLLMAFDSSLASVLNEAVLKKRPCSTLGVDRINILLYSQTFSILVAVLVGRALWLGRPLEDEIGHLGNKLDRSAVALVIMQSLLGLVVSRVLLYADAMAKTMAGGVREIAQVLVAPHFVTSRLDWISFPAVLWIAAAVVTYFAPPEAETTKALSDEALETKAPWHSVESGSRADKERPSPRMLVPSSPEVKSVTVAGSA